MPFLKYIYIYIYIFIECHKPPKEQVLNTILHKGTPSLAFSGSSSTQLTWGKGGSIPCYRCILSPTHSCVGPSHSWWIPPVVSVKKYIPVIGCIFSGQGVVGGSNFLPFKELHQSHVSKSIFNKRFTNVYPQIYISKQFQKFFYEKMKKIINFFFFHSP